MVKTCHIIIKAKDTQGTRKKRPLISKPSGSTEIRDSTHFCSTKSGKEVALTTNPSIMPSYGHRSYAEIIKQRLIYGRFYSDWSMRQGRYHFNVMYGPDTHVSRPWDRQPIGYEMSEVSSSNAEERWVLRVYNDGTALFRPYKLSPLRYPTIMSIKNVVEYFFYKEEELPVDSDGYHKMQILRRRALNPQHATPQAQGFGDFLESKYNQMGA